MSAEWAPRLVEAGAVVVDNTSYWRMHDDVPLVVAEVNPEALDAHQGIVANPNCSAMQMVVALAPIHRAVGIERIVVSTYQPVSGTGRRAMDELRDQAHALLHDTEPPPAEVYPHRIAFNVLPQVETFKARRRLHHRGAQDDGRDAQDPRCRRGGAGDLGDLRAGPGAVRGVRVGQRADARAAVAAGVPRAAGPGAGRGGRGLARATASIRWRATPPAATRCWSAAIRRDPSHERCLNMWIVGDNLRKGAATNAVQLAELLHERGLIRPAATPAPA